MTFTTLHVRTEPDVTWVRMDRPGRQNSIDAVLLAELHRALDVAEQSPTCRVVVLQGTCGVFCTGMDFTSAVDAELGVVAERGGEEFLGLLKRMADIPRVVVAEVDGRVAGGGVGLAAAADLVFATPRSTFGLPEALWGLLPCCVLPFLIRRVGYQPAHAMTISTLPVAAPRAYEIGLVDELADDPVSALRRLRTRVTKLDPATIGDAKAYLQRMWIVDEATERAATDEFARLMSAPQVRDRLEGFTQRQTFPWERQQTGGVA